MAVTREIPAEKLRPGMFVSRLDVSWFDHPFLTSRVGLVKDVQTIERLKAYGVSRVEIDLSKGLDVEAEPGPEPPPPPPPAPQDPAPPPPPSTVPPPSDQRRTLLFARKLFSHAVHCARRVLGSVGEGANLELDQARMLVGRLVSTVNSNGSVLRILSVLKAYDEYTFTHCVNVASMGVLFGKHMGLSDARMEELGLAGLLHDVGKCMLPSELVNKPGSLTSAEYEEMKRHSALGWEYVRSQPGIEARVARGILEHHERLDGSGYPGNLKGEQIGGISRVLSVLDVYDALTSNRVYRRGMSPHMALRTLYESRGGAFAAGVLDRFISCVGVYPPSSVVQLRNGCYAVVVGHNELQPLQPDVVVFRGPDGKPVKPRRVSILRMGGIGRGSGYEIVRHVEPSEMLPPDERIWL